MIFELDPAQKQDVDDMLAHKRWMLLHEPGVGKTPPAVVAATLKLPCLVTVPAYLIPQWEEYIKNWSPGSTIASMNENGFDARNEALHSDADFVLTSYHNWAAPKKYEGFWKIKWESMIFDEAHRLRGRNSKWTKAVQTLTNVDSKNKNVHMWFLTGTPIVRDGGDLFPLLKLCDKQVYSSYWSFVERWCKLDITPWATEVKEVKDPVGFQKMLAQYSSRREATYDTEAVYEDLAVDLPVSVRNSIRKLKKDFILEHPDMKDPQWFTSAGAIWAKIRQVTSVPPTKTNPKMEALKGKLEDIGDDRVVVACWFKNTANCAKEVIEKLKRPVALFTGDQSPSQKEDALRLYRNNENGILICTVAAMKEGVNLQQGRHTIFLEESELGADNLQLVGRQYRRGQERTVIVTRIFARQSVDERVHRLSTSRNRDARNVMAEFFRSDD